MIALFLLPVAVQVPDLENDIRAGYAYVAGPTLALRQISTIKVGPRTTQYEATLRWFSGNEGSRDVVKVEIDLFRDGRPERRVVCDGRTVWAYSDRSNGYAAVPIDRTGENQATDYRTTALNTLGEFVPGPSSDLLRLAKEIVGESAPVFRSWLPGVRAESAPSPRGNRSVRYTVDTGNTKQVTFFLQSTETDAGPEFVGLRREERSIVGGQVRMLVSSIVIEAIPLNSRSVSFVFQPPAKATSQPPSRFAKF